MYRVSLSWLRNLPAEQHQVAQLYQSSLQENYNYQVIYQKATPGFPLLQLVASVLWLWNGDGIEHIPLDNTQMFYSLMNTSRDVQLSFQKLSNLSLEEYNTSHVATDWLRLKQIALPQLQPGLDSNIHVLPLHNARTWRTT